MSTFKAHSVRGASASTASNMGITTREILEAADWSSESIFQRFYYKSTVYTEHFVWEGSSSVGKVQLIIGLPHYTMLLVFHYKIMFGLSNSMLFSYKRHR